mmetsp:Transcript_14198/g.10253  ORF Transcript_14198/g.10253 Transcript_14198/m.10253 type:complete len:88 (+) Transcript_14198:396-659(+)
MFFAESENGKLQIFNYNQNPVEYYEKQIEYYESIMDFVQARSLEEKMNEVVEALKAQDEMNDRIKDLHEASVTDPSFISRNEVLFLN